MTHIPYWSKEIKRLVSKLEVENHYPDDNLITCYKDFLRIRDSLRYYQFNPVVFQSLVALTICLWETKERISRLSLLTAIKHYANREKNLELDIQTRKHIFTLFRNTFEKSQFLPKNHIIEAQHILNYLLVNITLTNEEERWFCENENQSTNIINRILRYPVYSKIITQWVKEHFNSDKFHTRRAEAVGWLLDETPDFIVEEQTLIDDFEYTNLLDIEKIKNKDLSFQYYPHEVVIERFYIRLKINLSSNVDPDFENVRKYFYDNIDIIKRQTMLWAVAYSRLDVQRKMKLFERYYSDELFFSLFNICKKYKLIEVLKWLQTKTINYRGLSRKKELSLNMNNETEIRKDSRIIGCKYEQNICNESVSLPNSFFQDLSPFEDVPF
jgi:hypothetical protein